MLAVSLTGTANFAAKNCPIKNNELNRPVVIAHDDRHLSHTSFLRSQNSRLPRKHALVERLMDAILLVHVARNCQGNPDLFEERRSGRE